jgi:hypothetical protein
MKLNPEVYRKAAQRIEQGHNYGCCYAVAVVECHGGETRQLGPHEQAFNKVFRPDNRSREGFWVTNLTTPETSQPIRATMLYLMAELVETNSLP